MQDTLVLEMFSFFLNVGREILKKHTLTLSQTGDLHHKPLLTTSQSVPTESRVSHRAEYGDWSCWCLIKFLGLSNCLWWTSERQGHYTHCN